MSNPTTLPPKVSETSWGGWIAVSAPDALVKIGVIGTSEWEARERFECSMAAWLLNLGRPDFLPVFNLSDKPELWTSGEGRIARLMVNDGGVSAILTSGDVLDLGAQADAVIKFLSSADSCGIVATDGARIVERYAISVGKSE